MSTLAQRLQRKPMLVKTIDTFLAILENVILKENQAENADLAIKKPLYADMMAAVTVTNVCFHTYSK